MARILIFEPHDDIRSLLELVVRRLGHEAIVFDGSVDETPDVDAAIVEPGEGVGMPIAQSLRARHAPVIFTSIFPAAPDVVALEPCAYLVKPFPLYELENALVRAVELIPQRTA